MSARSSLKVMLIGIDGATWDLLLPWIKEGHLQSFKDVVERGTYGVLISTIPPDSIPAWPSMFTGKNPGKHGVFTFLTRSGRIVNARDIKSPTLWSIASTWRRKCCIINVPCTYPPSRINGIIVSSWLTPPGRDDFAYPSHVAKLLKRMGYIIDLSHAEEHLSFEEYMYKYRYRVLDALKEVMIRRVEAAEALIELDSWDLFVLVFTETDVAQHLLWDDKQALLSLYKELEKHVIKLFRKFKEMHCKNNENCILILASDHGFGDAPQYLINLGYLIPHHDEVSVAQALARSFTQFLKSVSRSSFWNIYKPIAKIAKLMVFNRTLQGGPTRGVRMSSSTIYLESHMKVYMRALYRKMKLLVKKGLLRGVWYGKKLYWGPFVNEAPNIICLPQRDTALTLNPFVESVLLPLIGDLPGSHHAHEDGIFVAYTDEEDVVRNVTSIKVNIYDITPTVLWMLGVPIPSDTDGKPRLEILEEKYSSKLQPELINGSIIKIKERTLLLRKTLKKTQKQ